MRLRHRSEPPPPPPPLTATLCIEGFEVSLMHADGSHATSIKIKASKDDITRIQQAIIYKLKERHGVVRTNYSDGHLTINAMPFEEVKAACEALAASIQTPEALTAYLKEASRIEHGQITGEHDRHIARLQTEWEKASQPALVAFLTFCEKYSVELHPEQAEHVKDALMEAYAGSRYSGRNAVDEAIDLYMPVMQAFFIGANRKLNTDEAADLRGLIKLSYEQQTAQEKGQAR